MAEQFGACVVLIPQGITADVEGGAHVTLAYFGDQPLEDAQHSDLLDIVKQFAEESPGVVGMHTDDIELFGPDRDAVVLTIKKGEKTDIHAARNIFMSMLDDELYTIFDDAETFPEYRPHITMGYISEGYKPSSLVYPEFLIAPRIEVWNGGDRQGFDLNEDQLVHYGTKRHSGRYPWGSGEDPEQRSSSFLGTVDEMRKQGLSEVEIAKGLGITTTQLRARKTIAKNELKAAQITYALKLKEKAMSNIAIGEQMGLNESSVRQLLDPATKMKNDKLTAVSDFLSDQVHNAGMIDIGSGSETHILGGVSELQMKNAVAVLQEKGYEVHNVLVDQLGTGNKTKVRVLAPPGTEYRDIVKDTSQIKSLSGYVEDGIPKTIKPPVSVDSKRIEVRYADDGGSDMDGVIQIRRGVDDISLGGSKYAQVRVAVDGTHYLKGMAMYTDDLPDGVDIRFNTNKNATGNKLDAMKAMKDDPDNPFGATVRQREYIDASGKTKQSVMNIVNEEGDWDQWSRNLSSQMLSKQAPALAKKQLELTQATKRAEFDEIMALTNPEVKKELLRTFADNMDSSAVHLRAAALPRQKTQVILPINTLKDNEIYAPQFLDGESVALVRYPHGGIFEIPELVVNNKNPQGRSVLQQATDAVGINSKVAGRLSGADFDGDTVLVIPNNNGAVKSSAPLQGLKGFDPQASYPSYEGMKPMSARTKQLKMGDVSNLITDMTNKGATNAELARAVRHSMVVIDAEKHKLNWKQSAIDNDIAGLKEKYQKGRNSGADTLISKASSEQRVGERKLRSAKDGGSIDAETGRVVWDYTGATYTNAKGREVAKQSKSTRMAEVDDAFDLISPNGGTPMEAIYATHANYLKGLANTARKELLNTPNSKYSPTARETYANEVNSLKVQLNEALKNKPRERQAQIAANHIVRLKQESNPQMDAADLKKVKSQALAEARVRAGAAKSRIVPSDKEWEAIQNGAVSSNFLRQILSNADMDRVRELATPRAVKEVSGAKLARAKSMMAAGYTQGEIAAALGVSTSTVNEALSEG